MTITVFKNINETETPYYRGVLEILDRVREGNSQALVEAIRNTETKEERNKLKKGLPSICFSGKFSRREDKAILEHSGLICLDFDGFVDEASMFDLKDTLSQDNYTFACFISPSGDGLKLLVKIPPNPEMHIKYFLSLEAYYNSPNWDRSCKNISRVCYESYDPDIYVNEFSFLWDTVIEETYETHDKSIVEPHRGPTIKLDEPDEIVRRLIVWWERDLGMSQGEKNNNLHTLAQTLNEYGISEAYSLEVCLRYDEGGKYNEILALNKSAYRYTDKHNTKFFDDNDKLDEIRRDVKSGRPVDDIVQSIKVNDKDALKKVVEYIIEQNSDDEFWERSSKGRMSVVPNLFRKFLTNNGFYKYFHAGSDKSVFVRVINNLIEDTTEDAVKDFVMDYLDTLEDKSVYNYFAGMTKLFKEDFLSILKRFDPQFVKDDANTAYLYYRNTAVRITKDEVRCMDYIDIDGFVWRKQIIDRDYSIADADSYKSSDYSRFINCVGGIESDIANIKSTIGFMLHSFKSPAFCPAVIINDAKISDNPEGGTGKGIFVKALGKVKKQVIIAGKEFKFGERFLYQAVSADTQVLAYDDVEKNFNFEKLFNVITEGISLEKKNKDSIDVPFEDSPKIILTSNYAIRGSGHSNDRRKWELEFKQYFNRNHSPQKELGRMMFVDWDEEEWNRFDNYMVNCLKGYLDTGFVASEFENMEVRKFIAETSEEFYEWTLMKDNHQIRSVGVPLNNKDLYEKFIEEFPDYGRYGKRNWSQNYFNKCLGKYAFFFTGCEPIEGRNNIGKTITFLKKEVELEDMQRNLGF